MKVWRLCSRLVLTIVGMIGLALVVAFALTEGLQQLANPPARAQAQAQCGTGGFNLQPYPDAVVTLIPNSGLAGSSFEVDLADILPNSRGDEPVEALWDWDFTPGQGSVVGSGTIPKGATEVNFGAEVPIDAQPPDHTVTVCWRYALKQTWYYKSATLDVTEPTLAPTPTPTPTPTPPPAEFICTEPPATRTFELQVGWNNFVWTGASGADPATALSCIEGNYGIAYRLVAANQTFERHVPSRCDEQPGLCNMSRLNTDDNLLVLVTAPGLVCDMPVALLATPMPEPTSLTLDLEPGWNNFVWRGASGADPATALSAIEGNYDIAYRFDPSSQTFERYVPSRCEEQPGLCDMTRLNRFDILLVKKVFRLRNPALNSAITAHGNTDWHIDTAEEFLFGTDMGGSPLAANHTPDTWTRRHMHVGLTNTANFYYDSDLTPGGADTDATSGIDDGAMLFFYAGHGDPTGWDTLGNGAGQGNMSLADWQDGGRLRYYWQCSCEVFAHGPLCPGFTDPHFRYACVGDFDGSADSSNMRNVYERWGPALEPDLRMACGASTAAWCHEDQTNAIWNNYNNLGFDVADSFIEGLAVGNVVPLCITMGGPDVTTTPLYDTAFTNQPNTSGTSHYHIQYLSNFASNPLFPELLPHQIPELLPIYEVKPPPLPDPIRDVEFECEGDFMTHDGDRGEPWTQVRVNRLSGAVNLLVERKATIDGPVLEEEEYIERALSFIGEQRWDDKDFAEPMGARFMIETMPVDADADVEGITLTRGDMQRSQKNVVLTFKRRIDVDGMPVSVLGEGGEMTVQMNNDGSVMNASNVWREISGVKEEAPVKTYDEAYEEALEQLKDPQAYELDDWRWGYLEAAGNVEQTELRIVFRFWFVATDPEALMEYPPQMIEIPGQPQ